MKKKDSAKMEFTPTEVGTLLEEINHSVKIIAEGHSDLNKKMDRLEIEVHGNSRRLDMLEVTSRITHDKVSHLEDAVSKLDKDLNETRQELKTEIAEAQKGLKEEIKEAKLELKRDIEGLGNRLTAVEAGR